MKDTITRDLSLLTKEDTITLFRLMLGRDDVNQGKWCDHGSIERTGNDKIEYVVVSTKGTQYKATFYIDGEFELHAMYPDNRKYVKIRRIRNMRKLAKHLEIYITVDSASKYSVSLDLGEGQLSTDKELSNMLARFEHLPAQGEILTLINSERVPVVVKSVETYLSSSEDCIKHLITVKKIY